MNNSTIEYVGVDYHTKYALATRMTYDGQIISQDKIDNTREAIRAYMATLPAGSQVAVEATNNWYAFCEFCHDLPLEIKLVHPGKTKAIAFAKIKTDSLDSKTLADLLRTNYIAQSYLAPQGVRDLRELIRYRTTLTRIRTQFKTRIRSILFKVGTQVKSSEIDGQQARQELNQLFLRPIYRDEINSCLTTIEDLKRQRDIFDVQITGQAQLSPTAKLLMSIPGISFYSGLLIDCEIGDWSRFNSSRKLCAAAGLVPSTYSSGGKTRRGGIIKQGNSNLRFVLLQAVPHVIKKSDRLSRLYHRLMKKRGKQVARIAVARKLLAIMLSMIKTGREFTVSASI